MISLLSKRSPAAKVVGTLFVARTAASAPTAHAWIGVVSQAGCGLLTLPRYEAQTTNGDQWPLLHLVHILSQHTPCLISILGYKLPLTNKDEQSMKMATDKAQATLTRGQSLMTTIVDKYDTPSINNLRADVINEHAPCYVRDARTQCNRWGG
jgi:hypothetical protein